MSWKCSFLPARQSLQNQLPSGISMFRQSGWKAAGQDSQHSRLPPLEHTKHQLTLTWAWCLFPFRAVKWPGQMMLWEASTEQPAARQASPP